MNLMSAPGPCLVQGAIGPGARDRGLALDKYFCICGVAEHFLYDDGPQFRSHQFQVVLRDWGVTRAQGTIGLHFYVCDQQQVKLN